MNRLPIRWRLTLWFGATMALVLIVFSFVLFVVMRHQLLGSLDTELAEESREITTEMAEAETLPEMLRQLERGFAEHGEFYFDVRGPAENTLFKSRALQGHEPLGAAVVVAADSSQFQSRNLPGIGSARVMTRKVDGPGGPYVVLTATSREPFERQMSLLITVLLASIPVALTLALLGGYTLARRVLSPIDRMVEVANRITATDLDQRIEIATPGDELGRLAQTINLLIDRLQKAIEEMRRFTADAAHELRTPLAVLRSGIEVTLRLPRSADEYRRSLDAAAEESSRLTRLADQLLFLSRQDAGMNQIEREEVRIDAVIKDVVDRFEAPAREAGLTLSIEPLEPCLVRGDDIRLSQVFFNALDNAIKYTPTGGSVTVRGRVLGTRVRVEVEDSGVGIPPEHLAHVFKRFYRASLQPSGARGGSGLGLAIARSAVDAHGGAIWLESEVGRGTVLRVELPLMEHPSAESLTFGGATSSSSR